MNNQLRITFDASCMAGQERYEDRELLANFCHYMPFSSPATELRLIHVWDGATLVALAPMVKICRRDPTAVLALRLRRTLAPFFTPFVRRTTVLIDTAFLGFPARSPFFCFDAARADEIKCQVSQSLRRWLALTP